MCEDAFESRKPTCATYRCPNGCVHLVWNNVTLHLLPSEWDLLAETVAETDRAVREDRRDVVFRDAPAM